MRIAIIGYGKMGKEIESMAIQSGHVISSIIDFNNASDANNINSSNSDVIIEFTKPDSVIPNMETALRNNVPFVTGTTGWHNRLDEIEKLCSKYNGSIFYASNFSIGVNLFFEFSRFASNKINNYKEYNIRIEETHHTQKLDTPSGTAISLANNILPLLSDFTSWNHSESAKSSELPITSHRKENIVGIHNLIFESNSDSIELIHHAKNRKGFAKGALLAAEFIINKKGIFTMSDLINQ